MKKSAYYIFLLGAMGLASGLTSGCISSSKNLTKEDREKLKAYVLDTAPSDMTKVDINFDNRARILGYRVEPAVATPGTEVQATFFWSLEGKVQEGWEIFTHVGDAEDSVVANLDSAGPMREKKRDKQIFGPERWEKGKIYEDKVSFRVPEDMKSAELRFYVGIWNSKESGGNERLPVVSGRQDGLDRAIVFTMKTGQMDQPGQRSQGAGNKVPELVVMKKKPDQKIVIDGKGDDKAWQTAASTAAFVDVSTGLANQSFPVNAKAKITWDDKNMYVLFDVSDPVLVGGFNDPKSQPEKFTAAFQPKLWTEDTVEMMIDPDGDGDAKDYYEVQISPQNKVFHSQFDSMNQPNGGSNGPFGHEDWDLKLSSAVLVKGTLDKNSDKDEGYVVEAALPWSAFSKAKSAPPKSGDRWRMNFYAMEKNSGVSWSPILGKGNFHFAPQFGRVVWMDDMPSSSSPPSSSDTPHNTGVAGPGEMPSPSSSDTPHNTGWRAPRPSQTPLKGTVKLAPAQLGTEKK